MSCQDKLNPLASVFHPGIKPAPLNPFAAVFDSSVKVRDHLCLDLLSQFQQLSLQAKSSNAQQVVPNALQQPSGSLVSDSLECGIEDCTKFDQKAGSVANESKALTEFHLFPDLPTELRLKIWKFTTPGPRLLIIYWSESINHAISPTAAPALLHVCRKSREVGMKRYSLLFNAQPLTQGLPPRVYVDLERDTLYFTKGKYSLHEWGTVTQFDRYMKDMTQAMNTDVFNTLRRVALYDNILDYWYGSGMGSNFAQLGKFKSLSNAALVLESAKTFNQLLKVVEVTCGACQNHSSTWNTARKEHDEHEVVHSCRTCINSWLTDVVKESYKDEFLFTYLEASLLTRGMHLRP